MSNIQRYGRIIAVKDGMLEHYIDLHNKQSEEIRDLLKAAGCLKCDIYTIALGGKNYLFQSLEMDEDAVSVDLRQSSVYAQWEKQTGACQIPIQGAELWKDMKCVYTLDKTEREHES